MRSIVSSAVSLVPRAVPFALVACSPSGVLGELDGGAKYTTEGPASVPGQDSVDTGDPGDTGDTGDTGDVPPVDYDCAALADEPLEKAAVDGARGYHGIVFDDAGNLLGWDGRSAIVAAQSDGTAAPAVTGISSAEQMVRLDDGRIFVVNQWEYGVDVITPEGARTSLTRGLYGYYPYGITLGPDGMLYVTDGHIYRLDPDTGDLTVLWEQQTEWQMPHAVGFSLDSTRLFIAMVGDGQLFAVDLDENLDFVGNPEPYVRLDGGWQDAVGVDACGNLYVPDYYTSRLYRVTPEGEATVFHQAREQGYGHGVAFGTGRDGWSATAIYQPLPYDRNSVGMLEIGVPDGARVRTWNGVLVGR